MFVYDKFIVRAFLISQGIYSNFCLHMRSLDTSVGKCQ